MSLGYFMLDDDVNRVDAIASGKGGAESVR